jgi:hypothetical protein
LLDSMIRPEELEKRKNDYKKIRERVSDKYGNNVMQFYDKVIGEDRRKELSEMVVKKRRVHPLSELEKKYKDLDIINDQFEERFGEFMSAFKPFEQSRIETFNRMKEIEVMGEYLMKRQEEEKQSAKVKDIIMWSQVADSKSYSVEDVERVRKEHLEKLERFRKRKDWEAWAEEDELDIEGERILSEIKNYKDEYFHKVTANFV